MKKNSPVQQKPSATLTILCLLVIFATQIVFPLSVNSQITRDQRIARVLWSAPSVEVNITPGSIEDKFLTFFSSVDLLGATIEISPEIDGFLNVTPQTIYTYAWNNKSLHLEFEVPAGTSEGRYEGTVSVVNEGAALPDTLRVVINVVSNAEAGRFTIYNNATDPLLLKARTDDGDIIEYFGERNSRGSAESLTSIRMTSVNNEVTTYFFDNMGRPNQIEAFNGTVFKIQYFSSTRVFLNVFAPDGSLQISAPIDLNSVDAGQFRPSINLSKPDNASENQSKNELTTSNNTKSLINQTDDLCVADLVREKTKELVKANSKPENSNSLVQTNNTVTANITQCNVPENNASVELLIEGNSFLPGSLPMVNIGSGKYQASLPSSNDAIDNFERQCEALAQVLQRACEAAPIIRDICLALTVIATFLPPAAGLAPIFAACTNILARFENFCRVFPTPRNVPVPSPIPTAATILAAICNSATAIINRFRNARINLQVVARKNGEEKRSFREFNLDPNGPFPELSVNFEKPFPEVQLVTTTPAVPDTSQGYVVNADIHCIDADDNLTISYNGSDGSQGSTTCLLVDSGTCFLTVPPGRTSSQDIITIKNNGTIIKTVVLNFTQIGSITVRDNGSLADDAFSVALDGNFVGQTAVGSGNEFSIRNLRSGFHTLTITGVVVPDNVGTYEVSLRNGLTFSGGGTVRSGVIPLNGTATFTIIVP